MSLYDDNPALSGLDDTPAPAGNGLGSLADELAGAFGDYDAEGDEDYGEDGEFDEFYVGGEADTSALTVDTDISGAAPNHKHTRSDYDGSEYGDPDDLVDSGITFGLEDKLSQIERLAMRSRVTNVDGDEDAQVVTQLMEGLQKLLPQSQLETGSTRLITAHSALASHMLHQTRTLRDLSYAITAATLPPEETADLLLALTEHIPRPMAQPLAELTVLRELTGSLAEQLAFLSDTLHMARQSSMTAGRKLRVAKEACADWKTELEMADKARRWIEDGDWDARCRRREAMKVCKEVTGGFEDVCRGMEEKLRAQEVVA